MKNILNIDTKQAPYSLGYANVGGADNIIAINFKTNQQLTNARIEITKIDGTIETFVVNGENTNITFALFQAIGNVQARLLSDEFNSEYVSIVITEDIGLYDNAIVKIIGNEFSVRKVKTKSSEEAYDFITLADIESLFK